MGGDGKQSVAEPGGHEQNRVTLREGVREARGLLGWMGLHTIDVVMEQVDLNSAAGR